ncbi:hypothetical protein [Streptomyces sp. NPDC020983]|uniref:hypothetical protein n=1 Tax=Streptomyces sp. NPDC020983 TaxID=3365106 RepID=UPI00378CDB28
MTELAHSRSAAEELRERAGAFVNSHVDLWVAVEDDGTLVLAGQNPGDLLQAAADWLADDPRYAVPALVWSCGEQEPAYTARLTLRRTPPS